MYEKQVINARLGEQEIRTSSVPVLDDLLFGPNRSLPTTHEGPLILGAADTSFIRYHTKVPLVTYAVAVWCSHSSVSSFAFLHHDGILHRDPYLLVS